MDIHAILLFRAEYRQTKTPAEKQKLLKEFIESFQKGITISDRAQFLFDLKQLIEPDETNVSELFPGEDEKTIQAVTEKNNQFEAEAQKNSGAEENLLPDDLLRVNHHANNYGFNRALYDKILPLTKLAYAHEKNGTPEEHAYKLAIMFKDEDAVIKYLTCPMFVKGKVSLHDACLFDIPESPPEWNLEVWRELASKRENLARNEAFKKILKTAGNIEAYIFKNLKTLREGATSDNRELKIKFLSALEKLQAKIKTLEEKLGKMEPESEEKIRLQKRLNDNKAAFKNTVAKLIQSMTVTDLNEIAVRILYTGGERNVAAASLCKEYGLSQRDFDLALSLIPQDSPAIPNVTLLGADIDSSYGSYYLKKLDSTDPRAFVLGKMTGCCQSIGGTGEGCAIHGITSPNGGFYVICKGNGQSPKATDRIVAQCWAWRGKDNGLVFDSIEYTKSSEEGKVGTTGRTMVDMIQDMYIHLASKLVDEEKYAVLRVMVGIARHTPKTMGWDAIGNSVTAERFSDYQGYSDSTYQHVLAFSNFPGYLYAHIKNIEQPDDFDNFWLKKIDNWFLNNKNKINEMLGPPPLNILQDWIASCISENKTNILDYFKEHLSPENKEKFERIVESSQKMYQERQKDITKLDFSLIKKLVEQGVSVDFPIRGRDSLLMLAFKAKDFNMFEELLNLGADINAKDKDGMTALGYAAENGRWDEVKLLLQKDADVNVTDRNGMTVLTRAAQNGQWDVVKCLLEKNADVNVIDRDGMTVLMHAAKDDRWDVVKPLLEKNADVKNVNATGIYGRTALLCAAKNGQLDVVKLLLDKNADVDAPDIHGMTALQYAAQNGRLDVVELLLEKCTDVDAKDKNGMTALLYAAAYKQWDVVKLLLEKNADVNATDKNGMTTLKFATLYNRWDVVKPLLEKCTDVDAKDEYGITTLLRAAFHYQWDVVKFLLKKGANVDEKDIYDLTTLTHAAQNGQWDVVKLLLEKCTIVDAKDGDGMTPLLYAAKDGQLDVVKLLLEKNADVNATDKNGMTPLQYATQYNHLGVVELLQEKLKKDANPPSPIIFGGKSIPAESQSQEANLAKPNNKETPPRSST